MTSTAPGTAALPSLLTVIITTSPTPSAPSADLISSVLLSFREHCPGLTRCRIIVVFDTYDRIEPKARLKKGTVTAEGARDYALYKDNVKDLVLREYAPDREASEDLVQDQASAEYGLSGDWNHVTLNISRTQDDLVTFIEPLQRLGFGLAVRSALRTTKTPYVWVHQHDWTLISTIPLEPMLSVMIASDASETAPVKYICLPSIRMTSYMSSEHVSAFPQLRALTASLRRDFSISSSSQPTAAAGSAAVTIPLTPLFFWHDKPHVASTAHYLARVFPTRLAVPRGAFIEDTVGQRARDQMKRGVWARWACWLYYPDEGRRLCSKHLNGRIWKGAEFELQRKLRLEAKGEQCEEAQARDAG